jgi:hypothetical protein
VNAVDLGEKGKPAPGAPQCPPLKGVARSAGGCKNPHAPGTQGSLLSPRPLHPLTPVGQAPPYTAPSCPSCLRGLSLCEPSVRLCALCGEFSPLPICVICGLTLNDVGLRVIHGCQIPGSCPVPGTGLKREEEERRADRRCASGSGVERPVLRPGPAVPGPHPADLGGRHVGPGARRGDGGVPGTAARAGGPVRGDAPGPEHGPARAAARLRLGEPGYGKRAGAACLLSRARGGGRGARHYGARGPRRAHRPLARLGGRGRRPSPMPAPGVRGVHGRGRPHPRPGPPVRVVGGRAAGDRDHPITASAATRAARPRRTGSRNSRRRCSPPWSASAWGSI